MVTIDDLPAELLHTIFKNLSGPELIKCRRVSVYFKEAIDVLPASLWKRLYCTEQKNAQQDKSRSGLAWKELCRSVYLWVDIQEAKPSLKHEFPPKNIVDLKVLNTGTLVLIQTSVASEKYLEGFYGDTVIHYGMEFFEEIDRKKYAYHFINYDENDTFIAYIEEKNEIHIYEKNNPTNFRVVGLIGICTKHAAYYLCNSKIFFFNHSEHLCIVSLIKRKGKNIIRVNQFESHCGKPLAYSHKCTGKVCNNKDINILNRNGEIYTFTPEGTDYVAELTEDSWFHLYISDYNFDWTIPRVLEWLYDHFTNDLLGITKYDFSCIHEYKNVLLFGTPDAKILIYVNPYIPNDGLKSFSQKSDKTVDVRKLCPTILGKITEMAVLEVMNGHRIAAIISGQGVVLDLIHPVGE